MIPSVGSRMGEGLLGGGSGWFATGNHDRHDPAMASSVSNPCGRAGGMNWNTLSCSYSPCIVPPHTSMRRR